MQKNEIYVIQGKEYKAMTLQILEKSRLEELIPAKDACIGIKPNLVSPSPASYGATTHPEVVKGIVEYLQQRGFRNLVILEGSWVGDRTAEAVKVCGYDRLCQKYGIEFWDTQKEKGIQKDCAGMSLKICRCVEKLDFLINVPVWKGHCQTKITCALKNLKGLIPNSEKRRFHSLGLHKPIAHLNGGIRQDFIVVDHICGDLDFEDGGNPVVCDQILTARDPVLCDAYVCEKMHYRQEEVPYIQLAQSLGVGSADLTTLSVQECQTGREDRELPRERKIVHVQDAVEEVESCSACYGYLIPALDQLREEGFLEKLKEKICIGQGFRGKKGNLGIGQCTREFTHSLEGCPPTENQIYEFLKADIREQGKEEGQGRKGQKKQ